MTDDPITCDLHRTTVQQDCKACYNALEVAYLRLREEHGGPLRLTFKQMKHATDKMARYESALVRIEREALEGASPLLLSVIAKNALRSQDKR